MLFHYFSCYSPVSISTASGFFSLTFRKYFTVFQYNKAFPFQPLESTLTSKAKKHWPEVFYLNHCLSYITNKVYTVFFT